MSKTLKMYHLDDATEAQFPPGPASIFEKLKVHLVNQSQHFALLLHVLMLEVGFRLNSTLSTSDHISAIAPQKECFNDNGAGYRFYYLADHKNEGRCVLQVIPYGTKVTVIGTFAGQPQASFTMEDVPLFMYLKNISSPSFPSRFKNMKCLSKDFKDGIALPLLSHAKNSLGLPVGTESFSALHNDAMLAVLKHVRSAVSLVRVGQCSKATHETAENNGLWKYLLRQDFPDQYRTLLNESHAENSAIISWKSHYKRFFRAKIYQESLANDNNYDIPLPAQFIPIRPRMPPPGPFRGPLTPRYDPPFGPNFGLF